MFSESISRISDSLFGVNDFKIREKGNWTLTSDGIKVLDDTLVKFTLDHMYIKDKFDPKRIIVASLYAFDILAGQKKEPKSPDWKFRFRS